MSEAIKPKFWVDVHMNVMSAGGMVAFPCISAGLGQQQENAGLIAEALNVRDSTGLTPRQLVERAKELEDTLRDAVDCGMVPKSSAADGGASKYGAQVRVADRIRTALSRALPNTVAEVK